MMPHPSMKPVKMPGGRSVVLFSCYEYRNVMNSCFDLPLDS